MASLVGPFYFDEVNDDAEISSQSHSGAAAGGGINGGRVIRPSLSRDVSDFFEIHRFSLGIVVIGASGDLAKKKTYPSLLALYIEGFLPETVRIFGYARSKKTDEEFRAHLRPFLAKKAATFGAKGEGAVERFLSLCVYRPGQYDSEKNMGDVSAELETWEAASKHTARNRIFYMAIPPSLFVTVGRVVANVAQSSAGWNRVIVEKPFGHDSESARQLSEDLGALFREDQLYRIDHYLGKEMVQNLLILRFGNILYEPLWNRDFINCVIITFKEDIGTQGRGGYFNKSGIIKDVIQNHLIQILSLVAMEPPVRCSGENYSNYVRNEKVKVLRCIPPIQPEDVVLGQYVGGTNPKTGVSEIGYLEDETVPSGSVTETFATVVLRVNNRRWDGVPFILKAGKALDERKAEVRIQFKKPPAATAMFPNAAIPHNELVLRLQVS